MFPATMSRQPAATSWIKQNARSQERAFVSNSDELSENEKGNNMMSKKWQTILLLALAKFFAMDPWFSASAVTPTLAKTWNLSAADAAWLTLSVREYMGIALTLQTSLGFLPTLASIRLIPVLVGWFGWQWLALGHCWECGPSQL